VVGQALVLTGAGILLGLLGALLLTRVLRALLFGVTPGDPVALGAVSLLLLAVALGASWLPARRAVRTDPLTAMRGG